MSFSRSIARMIRSTYNLILKCAKYLHSTYRMYVCMYLIITRVECFVRGVCLLILLARNFTIVVILLENRVSTSYCTVLVGPVPRWGPEPVPVPIPGTPCLCLFCKVIDKVNIKLDLHLVPVLHLKWGFLSRLYTRRKRQK